MKSEKPAEFDGYAADYEELIRDPIREKFAQSNRFFFERKIHVIRGFYARQGIDTHRLKWLDVGCGQGDMMRVGQSDFESTSGCDVSEGMLQHCLDLSVRRQPALAEIPFDERSFDFVTAVCVYHHVPEDGRPSLTSAILRVLKPGGVFCIIEHNPLNPATRLIVSRTPVDADAQLLRARTAGQLMSASGAKVIDTRYFLWLPQQIHPYLGGLEDGLSKVPLGGQYAVFGSKPNPHSDRRR